MVVLGVILGLLFAGGSDEPEAADTTLASTTTIQPQTTTSTTAPTTTTSEPAPTTPPTVPSEVGANLVVPVSEDATIASETPGASSGGDDELVADTDSADQERSLLRFEIEGIPDDQGIAQVWLRLFVVDSSGAPVLARVDGDWTETDVTWDNAPAVGEIITSIPAVPDETFVRVDVSSVVEGNGTVDLYLLNEAFDSYVVTSGESDQPPQLEIIFGDTRAVMVGAGDIASCESDGDEATAALIDQVVAGSEDDVVVMTFGDNAYESGTAEEFSNCYDPSWGGHKDITRPSPGSREYRTPGASGYFGYFGDAAGDPAEGYYSYDHGDWHVVSINSNCDEIGGCGAGSPLATWLEEDLASSDAACTLAYWHHPAFGSTAEGVNSDVVPLWEILHAAGAELVLNGDHHFYERFAAQDPTGTPTPTVLCNSPWALVDVLLLTSERRRRTARSGSTRNSEFWF